MNYSYSTVDEYAYTKARKLGTKAYHTAIQKGKNPYLPVLDEVVSNHLSLLHVNLGLVNIPLENLVGTGTKGRTSAFANNFLPLLDEDSEFASKWRILHHSVVQDGVREPIKVLEYMNKFYVLEGNKRVSVMKFLGSLMIEAEVTRIIPKRTEEKENKIYYEFLDFYKDTKINTIWFSEVGAFARLYELVGKEPGTPWTADEVTDFQAAYLRFSEALDMTLDYMNKLTVGDAFLIFLQVYGYNPENFAVSSEIRDKLARLRNEFKTRDKDESYSLLLSTQGQKPGIISQIIHSAPQKMKVAFVNNRSPEVSGWTYWHELGKNRVETVFGDKIETRTVCDVDPENCDSVIDDLIAEGFNIIFTTSPILLDGAVKAAVAHPDVKILNCSLLPAFHSVRSYYLRMHEAKYIIGAIAGAICDNDKIGYIADYPVYGAPPSINAFALGARLTNPRAKIYLEWSTLKDHDPMQTFVENDIHIISNRDISAPSHQSLEFGLYLKNDNGDNQNLAMPVWNWGRLYEDLLHRVQSGVWRTDSQQNNAQALNYWWGMDANAIDVFYSSKLDCGTRRLADLMRSGIRAGNLHPFADTILDQQGTTRCAAGQELTPAEIVAMDWLTDNVVGTIPTNDEIKPEAQAFVMMQGIHNLKAPDTSEIGWTDPKL